MNKSAIVLLVLIVGAYANPATFTPEYENTRFKETDATDEHALYKPAIAQNPTESLLHTSVPEPIVAMEPKKSWVEQVTGENDNGPLAAAFSFRATSEVAAGATAQVAVAEPEAHTAEGGDDRDKELTDALQNVKDEIVASASQIRSEKKWVEEVTKIIETYVHKTRRVNVNIRALQKKVQDLFRKKKQIENLILQRKLEEKLGVANKDLSTLQGALHNVQKKETAFSKSKKDITTTIGEIEKQLKRLRGEDSGSSGSSGSSSGSSSDSSSSAAGESFSS